MGKNARWSLAWWVDCLAAMQKPSCTIDGHAKGPTMKPMRDKEFLRELAKDVLTELHHRHIGTPFRFKGKLKPQAINSDGWAVTLGTFTGYQCWAEIWLDRFTSYQTRKVYYCLYSNKKDGLAKLAQAAYRVFGTNLPIFLKDWNGSDDPRLANQLAKARFGHPIYERYPEHREFLYGIYEYDRTGLQRNTFNRLVERAAGFFETIAQSVSHSDLRLDDDVYPTIENRLSVTRHLRRERRSHTATLCKQRDNYICQVCCFDFSKVYGELGEDFAEAHHIIPLSSNNKPRSTTADDLITVCSNCHRMLHRMSGKPKDIDNLRSIVCKRKAK